MWPRFRVALLLGCLCVGCERDAGGPPSAPPPEPAAGDDEVDAPPEPPPHAPAPALGPPDPRTPRGRARLEALQRGLREGRRLARAGDQTGAIAALERALSSVEDPRARCELGWARFRAGQLEAAARDLDRALDGLRDDRIPPGRRRTYAACLYNRGRVGEAAGDPVAAARAYRRSLALRPNDTVRAALDGLGDVSVPDDECAPICEGPFPTRDALRAGLEAALTRRHATVEFYCSDHGSDVRWGAEQRAPASPPFLAAHVSVFEHGTCYAGPERSDAVVEAQLETGWSGCAVLEAAGGWNESVQLGERPLVVRGRELVAGLAVLYYDAESAGDCNACLMEDEQGCDEICDYETVSPAEVTLVVRDGRLAPRSPICPARR